jgi:AmmeMemoRadiSam system protein B
MPAVREAVVDGLFYPAAPWALRAQIVDCLLGAGTADDAGRAPKLLIAPHAGYEYCGAVAAQAYALLARRSARGISRVVLLGPAHRVALDGLAVPQAEAFETPLGRVALDSAALAALEGLPQVSRSDRAHEREHSLEVQLPFLQTLLGNTFTLVPLVVGKASAAAVAQVLECLWGGDETLIVISSDLSHYLPYQEAQAADQATAQRILALDAALTLHEACGAAAINGALLAARRHHLAPRLLDLRNSGDTAGDRNRVVGYAAIAFMEPLVE